MAKKRAGDGYPLDRIGQMLFDGCLVIMGNPDVVTREDDGDQFIPSLVIGYIKKLGKSYADVTFTAPNSTESDTIRVRQPKEQLLLIDSSQLARTDEFEKLKVAAYNSSRS